MTNWKIPKTLTQLCNKNQMMSSYECNTLQKYTQIKQGHSHFHLVEGIGKF